MARAKVETPTTLTRRGLLSAVSALSVLPFMQWPTQAWGQVLNADDFLALSQELTRQDNLSSDIAAKMLKAFSEIEELDSVSALAAGQRDDDLANSIVASWYTGISPDPDDLQVITYTDALIWGAMTYSKPMAYCGGSMGYWAAPPEA